MNMKEEWTERVSQGPAWSLQTGRELFPYEHKPGEGIGADGGGAGRGRVGAGGNTAGFCGGKDRQGAGSADGRSGDHGRVDAVEASLLSGTAGAEERGIRAAVEPLGAGSADGAGEPDGDQQ